MADVIVTVVNKSGQAARLTMDEGDERIGHFRKMVRADDLESVDVAPIPEARPSRSAAK